MATLAGKALPWSSKAYLGRSSLTARPLSTLRQSGRVAEAKFIAVNKTASCLHSQSRRTLSYTSHRYEARVESGTLTSPSDLARKLSEQVLPRIPRPDVKKVLVVGSGGLSIGQAGEFDYSGTSLCDLSHKHHTSSRYATILIDSINVRSLVGRLFALDCRR